MNIFYLSSCPRQSAEWLCDKHISKMVLESVQVLNTKLHELNRPAFYRKTHYNHPSCIWARQSEDNLAWLMEHTHYMALEFERRYNKQHLSYIKLMGNMHLFTDLIGDSDAHTPPPQCMPDDCKQQDTTKAYQKYYRTHKAYMAKWNYSDTPEFMTT